MSKQPGRRGALGKGMSSLLGEPEVDGSAAKSASEGRSSNSNDGAVELSISKIDPNPEQPRKFFDDNALKELADSLKRDGFLQPIVVASGEKKGRYIIIAGERRWRASQLAGFTKVPVLIREVASHDLLRLALIENIQRADLNIIEEAEAYAALIRDHGLTQEQCAEKVGKDRSTVANALRLLNLPNEIRDDIVDSRLTMGHGRALLSLDEKKLMLRARDLVIKKELSVRQTEQLCKNFQKDEPRNSGSSSPNDADLNYITESLRGYLQTKVKLAGNTNRGRIEVSYFSAAELERILKIMGHAL